MHYFEVHLKFLGQTFGLVVSIP